MISYFRGGEKYIETEKNNALNDYLGVTGPEHGVKRREGLGREVRF